MATQTVSKLERLTISKKIAFALVIFASAGADARSHARHAKRSPAQQTEAAEKAAAASHVHRRVVGPLSRKQRKIRIKHAHELLGRYYKKSSVNVGESIPKINSAVYHWTREHLPPKYRDQSGTIAQTIIDQSTKHGFDPVFLMSVIEGESSWRPEKIGGVGEIGLMQIRPSTAKWMASRAGVKWKGDKTLFDPCKNIKIGAAYLSYLRDRFDDHARLYLAAYNMGQSNVDQALDKNIWPKDYPIHIMKRYVSFYETVGQAVTKPEAAAKAEPAVTAAAEAPSKTRARPGQS
jgi:soluble lytic murein transglycosylase